MHQNPEPILNCMLCKCLPQVNQMEYFQKVRTRVTWALSCCVAHVSNGCSERARGKESENNGELSLLWHGFMDHMPQFTCCMWLCLWNVTMILNCHYPSFFLMHINSLTPFYRRYSSSQTFTVFFPAFHLCSFSTTSAQGTTETSALLRCLHFVSLGVAKNLLRFSVT